MDTTCFTEPNVHAQIGKLKERMENELQYGEASRIKMIHVGRVLENDQTIGNCSIKPKGFIVSMIMPKPKEPEEPEEEEEAKCTHEYLEPQYHMMLPLHLYKTVHIFRNCATQAAEAQASESEDESKNDDQPPTYTEELLPPQASAHNEELVPHSHFGCSSDCTPANLSITFKHAAHSVIFCRTDHQPYGLGGF